MKRLMADIYKYVYKIVGSKLFSYLFTILLVTICNLLLVYGLSILLEGWIGTFKLVHKLFAYPKNISVTSAIMLYMCYRTMPSIDSLTKDKVKNPFLTPILLYVAAATLIFLYSAYGTSIFDAPKRPKFKRLKPFVIQPINAASDSNKNLLPKTP